jgi:hypothetical protein
LVSSNFLTVACVLRNNISFDGAAFTTFSGLILDAFIFNAGSAGNVWLATVNEGCFPMTNVPTYTQGGGGYPPCGWEFVDCLFRNGIDAFGNGKGAVWANGGGVYSLQNVEINDQAGDGVTCEGGYMFLQNVGGIGNTGVGVRANDGANVRCLDDNVVITGALGDLQAGVRPVRTWLNFRANAPIKNELDLTFPPVGDEVTPNTGGTSLSRIFQRPF